jgi:hypothetical protein
MKSHGTIEYCGLELDGFMALLNSIFDTFRMEAKVLGGIERRSGQGSWHSLMMEVVTHKHQDEAWWSGARRQHNGQIPMKEKV